VKTAGIVAEYNPFHLGHAYHLEQTKSFGATHTVAVMSGNFVQRGEPAFALKQSRVKAALACGVDLVIELPLPWACSGAETFAKGAVGLLNALGFLDCLSFGSESGDVELLQKAARAVDSEELNGSVIKDYIDSGMTFAAARETAVAELYGDELSQLLKTPNDILAVEYIRALDTLGSGLVPLAVKRRGAGHNEEKVCGGFASASRIRESIVVGNAYETLLPPASYNSIQSELEEKRAPAIYERLETAVLYSMRSKSPEEIADAPDVSEGIENRIAKAAKEALTLEELFSKTKTKRYTHVRIRRIVLCSFLGIKKEDNEGMPPYIRVLGFGTEGKKLLRKARKSASLPIIMKSSDILKLDENAKHIFDLECRSTDIYALALPRVLPCGLERKLTPVIFENEE
jgi:predicted nucleotidyltransferase